MNHPVDEVRLTTYALGELSEVEAREVERLLASDPAARTFVEEQRALAGSLEGVFGSETGAGLDDGRRDRVLGDERGFPIHLMRAAAVIVVCLSMAVVW